MTRACTPKFIKSHLIRKRSPSPPGQWHRGIARPDRLKYEIVSSNYLPLRISIKVVSILDIIRRARYAATLSTSFAILHLGSSTQAWQCGSRPKTRNPNAVDISFSSNAWRLLTTSEAFICEVFRGHSLRRTSSRRYADTTNASWVPNWC